MIRTFTIAWNNPFTSPPNGRARVLGRVTCDVLHPPLRPSVLGSGWGLHWHPEAQAHPVARWTPERRAAHRRRLLRARLERRMPLFADILEAEELAKRPAYFRGEYTDGR